MSRLAGSFAAAAPDVAKGMRAAVATLLPFYFATKLGRTELAWMALGGWLGTLVDPGGARATRAKALIAFALLGASALAVSETCASPPWLATVLLAVTAFGATLFRALGAASATVGTMVAVIVAIGVAKEGGHPVQDSIFFAAGAGWAVILSSIVWPVWTHLPVRRAVAAVFSELAVYAAALDACVEEGTPRGDARWGSLARQHHRTIRAAIEEALAMSLAIRARRPGESRLGSNLRVLLGMAETQFLLVVTLAVEIEALPPRTRPSRAERRLEALSKTYQALQLTLVARAIGARVPANEAASASLPPPPASPVPVPTLAARLHEGSRAALALSRALDAAADADPGAEERRPRVRLRLDLLRGLGARLQTLRDAVSPRSPLFRHALRVALAVGAASVVGQRLSTHSHWVTITTLAVLQPYPGATITRAVERVIGTVMGSLVAVGITMTLHAPVALAAILFPLSVASVAVRPRSYRLFTFFLTPVFVLLAERYHGDWWTAAARAADALVGGTIALVAALLWPSSEKGRLPDAIGGMLLAVGAYAESVLTSFDRRDRPDVEARVTAARRTAGTAIGEAEASLERLLSEPLGRAAEAEYAMQLVTYARRAAGASTALDTYARGVLPAGADAREFPGARVAAYVTAVLAGAAALVRGGTRAEAVPAPELPQHLDPYLRGALQRLLDYASLVSSVSHRG